MLYMIALNNTESIREQKIILKQTIACFVQSICYNILTVIDLRCHYAMELNEEKHI